MEAAAQLRGWRQQTSQCLCYDEQGSEWGKLSRGSLSACWEGPLGSSSEASASPLVPNWGGKSVREQAPPIPAWHEPCLMTATAIPATHITVALAALNQLHLLSGLVACYRVWSPPSYGIFRSIPRSIYQRQASEQARTPRMAGTCFSVSNLMRKRLHEASPCVLWDHQLC